MHKLLKQAFTLIELLVVIAIIGILSGLIIVGMSGMTQKAAIAKAQVFSNSLRNVLMMSLVSEWKFDGSGVADGGTALPAYCQDSWGINNCVINGGPLVYSGPSCIYGSCLKFNGSTDYLSISRLSGYSSPTTITMWINPDSYGTAPYGKMLAAYMDGCTSNGYALFLQPGGNMTTITNDWVLGNIIPLSKWTYFVFVKQSTGSSSFSRTIYINGSNAGTQNVSSAISDPSSSNFYVGGGSIPCWPSTYYSGYIDEMRIFNTIVPTSQIKEQYYAGLNGLLAKEKISRQDYQNRIGELAVVQH